MFENKGNCPVLPIYASHVFLRQTASIMTVMNLSEDNQFICLYRMAKDCDSLQSGRIFRRIASTGLLSNATELCSVQHSWRILFFLDGAGFKKSLEQSERG